MIFFPLFAGKQKVLLGNWKDKNCLKVDKAVSCPALPFGQKVEKNGRLQPCCQGLVVGQQVKQKGKLTNPQLPWPSKPESCFMGNFTTKLWKIQKAFQDCLRLVLLVHENMLLLGSDVASMLWVMNCTDCKHSWESSSAIPNCFLSLACFIICFLTGRKKKSYIKNRALLLFLAPALLGSWFHSLSFPFFTFVFIWRASDHPSLSRRSLRWSGHCLGQFLFAAGCLSAAPLSPFPFCLLPCSCTSTCFA